MISKPKTEDVSLPKPDSHRNLPYTRVRSGHKEYKSNQKLQSGTSGKSPSSIRFKKAFNSALIARSAFLQRRLTRQEWVSLKKAVARQCSRSPTDKLSCKLNAIQQQLNQVEKLVPVDISDAFSSLEVFKLQMDVLRRQMYAAILENDTLSETCPHFRQRTLFHVPKFEHTLYFRLQGNLNCIIPLTFDGNMQQLCCASCTEKRSDAFFEWTGGLITMRDTDDDFSLPDWKQYSSLKTLNPLSIQSVWTGIINHKFRSPQ